ncbi:MAG: beta-ketoacyl-ACP synthase II [Clostridia bacterium]|nr:beta-ketoacyl-ACP synthase II [Clostridia bacterium]
MKRVVITGLGTICPIGNNIEEMWESILTNRSGIDYIKGVNQDATNVKVAAEIKNIDLKEYLTEREIRFNSKYINYSRIAAKEAFLDSKLNENEINHDRFGVFISSNIGGCEKIEESYETGIINSYYIPSVLTNSASSIVAIDLKANGINMSISSACASGNNTIGEAYLKIKYGMQDIMIAGASEFAINKKILDGFSAMRAIYTGDDKDRASIPFDQDRQGFVIGEGTGIIVLEELEHALKRDAKIYAEIVGYGSNCDAYHITSPQKDGNYAVKAIELALKDAGINSNDIEYINAHGTGTILNDLIETETIKKAFKDNYTNIYVSSTKSMTGHMMSASGAIETIICAKALDEGFIPATINVKNIDSKCDLNMVINNGLRKEIKYALSNSFGFGGDNACLIFKKWDK